MTTPDRRTQQDRRRKPTAPLSFASLFGARNHFRRAEDREQHLYVDRYSLRAVATILVTILLSVLDAIFTLRLVTLGVAREANPFMAFVLQFGSLPFLTIKYFLTGGCLLWCLVHKNYRFLGGRLSVKWVIVAVLLLYLVLIIYELILLMRAAAIPA